MSIRIKLLNNNFIQKENFIQCLIYLQEKKYIL